MEAYYGSEMISRLERIESILLQLSQSRSEKEYYTTAEVAKLLGRAEFTIREWCRLKRVHATKRPTGRGSSKEWMISHTELQRIQNQGLLP